MRKIKKAIMNKVEDWTKEERKFTIESKNNKLTCYVEWTMKPSELMNWLWICIGNTILEMEKASWMDKKSAAIVLMSKLIESIK